MAKQSEHFLQANPVYDAQRPQRAAAKAAISMKRGPKDVEAAAPPCTPPPVHPGGLSSAHKVAVWVAATVLVIAASAAIILGALAGSGVISSGGSSSGSSAGGSGSETTRVPPPVPQPIAKAPGAGKPAPVPSAALPASLPPPAANATNATAGNVPFFVPAGFRAVWWDEFDAPSLNPAKWQVVTGPPPTPADGVQQYTAALRNVAVGGGNLSIAAVRDGAGYTSGQLKSKQTWFPGMLLPGGGKVASVHISARIKAPPAGQGLLAALTLQPVEEKYGKWPASGEINVMAFINGMREANQAIHYGDVWPANEKSDIKTVLPTQQPFSAEFHTFALDWAVDTMTMKIDNQKTASFDSWWTSAQGAPPSAPFNHPFSLVL